MNKKIGLSLLTFLIIGGLVANVVIKKTADQPPQSSQSTFTAHSVTIKSDQDFLNEMIPHHQEAVSSSQYVFERTQNQELKTFLQSVITAQTTEITQMKTWHESWFNQPYQVNDKYMPMMGNLTQFEGSQLEKNYIEGMIAHHQGAIEMANQVKPLTQRTEIITLAEAIIATQEQEVALLKKWLTEKY